MLLEPLVVCRGTAVEEPLLVFTSLHWFLLESIGLIYTSLYWSLLVYIGFYWSLLVLTGLYLLKHVSTGLNWSLLVFTGFTCINVSPVDLPSPAGDNTGWKRLLHLPGRRTSDHHSPGFLGQQHPAGLQDRRSQRSELLLRSTSTDLFTSRSPLLPF